MGAGAGVVGAGVSAGVDAGADVGAGVTEGHDPIQIKTSAVDPILFTVTLAIKP